MVEPSAPQAIPLWDRSRFRWINGLGFAISSALVLIFVLGVLTAMLPGGDELEFQFPVVYAAVATMALMGTLVLFGVLMFRFWRGARFDTPDGRLYVFFWSLAGGLFFLSLALIWIRFDSPPLPNIPQWITEFLWFLCPFGVVTFALMSWTNSDLPNDHDELHDDDEYDDEHDE